MPVHNRPISAALTALITLQFIMLLSLFSRTSPHPPEVVAPFGIAPFLGASLAIAAAALIVGPIRSRLGVGLSLTAALCALVSFGPQKYLDASLHSSGHPSSQAKSQPSSS